MRHLRTVAVYMGIGMETRRHIVGMIAHLFHDVDLAVGRPAREVDGHHPEGWPSALALRQLDAGFHVAISPTLAGMGIDAAGIDLSVLLEAADDQRVVLDFRHKRTFG